MSEYDYPSTFRMKKNKFGLYEFSVNRGWRKIPNFLRPQPADPGGLSRGTSTGNFHEPYIQTHEFGREHLIVDRANVRVTVFEILRRGFTLLEEEW